MGITEQTGPRVIGAYTPRRRLRVGVLADLLAYDPLSGHGRVWGNILDGLAERVELLVEEGSSARLSAGPDVWLADGHNPLPEIDCPLLVQLHEVGWRTSAQAPYFALDWTRDIDASTAAAAAAGDRFVTGSEFAKHELEKELGIPGPRIDVVPHGVDLRQFRPGLTGGRAMVAHALGAVGEAPYVLFVASVHPRKNLLAVRGAVASLARRGFPQALAVVAASRPARGDATELERLASAELPGAHGRIARIPRTSDEVLAMLFAEADAFCMPSFSEGFGLTALEAMACGAPVIVSDRGALPELVGDAGLIVPPTAAAVEIALARVLSEPRLSARLRRMARARAERFTWSSTVDGWVAALERTASEHHDLGRARL